MRRIHRSDSNAAELVSAARKLGMLVYLTGRPTDALVGIRGAWYVVEFKAPSGSYTPAQKVFRAECEYHSLPMLTWRSVDDVAACV